MIPLKKISRVGTFTEIEEQNIIEYQGVEGGGIGKLLFNGYRVSVGGDEKILEINAGDGSTIL